MCKIKMYHLVIIIRHFYSSKESSYQCRENKKAVSLQVFINQ